MVFYRLRTTYSYMNILWTVVWELSRMHHTYKPEHDFCCARNKRIKALISSTINSARARRQLLPSFLGSVRGFRSHRKSQRASKFNARQNVLVGQALCACCRTLACMPSTAVPYWYLFCCFSLRVHVDMPRVSSRMLCFFSCKAWSRHRSEAPTPPRPKAFSSAARPAAWWILSPSVLL